MRRAGLVFLILFAATLHAAELVRKSCGYDPLLHRTLTDADAVVARGVNTTGSPPARWVNQAGVFPTPPDQKTVVTYSIVTSAESYAGQILNPINNADFIGANTLSVVREGVESWNDVVGIKLQYVQSKGQIRIGAGVLSGSVIGLGGYSAQSKSGRFYMTEGFVMLDNSDGAWDAPTLRAVSAHEIGHALGLNHTSDNNALMAPRVNGSTGPLADDRWYMQYLYGSAPAKLNASAFQSAPVTLNIGRAAPVQTGTDSTPTFDNSFDIGNGTGSKTQNDVLHYVVERKGTNDEEFHTVDSNVVAPQTQNTDGALSHLQNAFAYSDASDTPAGTYSYRVKAAHQSIDGSADDIYSATVVVYVGGLVNSSNPESIDSDGDGFPDAVEVAANTSPTDATSTPFGGIPVTDSQLLTISKASIALNFKTPARDTFSLAGTIPATEAISVFGQTAIVDFGGVVRIFFLSQNGSGTDRDAKARVGPKVSKGVLKFSFSASKGSFQTNYEDEGLTSRDTAKSGETISILATVYLQDLKYITPLTMTYKASAGKTGKAKLTK